MFGDGRDGYEFALASTPQGAGMRREAPPLPSPLAEVRYRDLADGHLQAPGDKNP